MATGTVIYTAVWQGLGKCSPPLLCDKYWDVVYPYRDSLSDGYCSWLGLAWYLGWNVIGQWFSMVISTLPLPALYELERIGNAKNSFYLGFRRDFIGLLRSDFVRD